MTRSDAYVYSGNLVHKRLRPVKHELRYRVFSLLLDVKKIDQTANRLRLFSYNRFNLFSFYDSDHGPGDGASILQHVDALLRAAGVNQPVHKVLMLCYPRVLGYGFNPLTTYYAMNKSGGLEIAIYEVNNTFGERKTYVVPVSPGEQSNGVIAQTCPKQLYVSPFNSGDGEYSFRISPPGDRLILGVSLRTSNGPLLKTYFTGERKALTDQFLLTAFIKRPLQSMKVTAAIHLEAFRLWRKGLKLVKRPAPPAEPVSIFQPTRNSGKKSA